LSGSLARSESGQALVVAAMAAFVLAAAFALTIDWGYALLQRRIAQNEADTIGLGVGRLLATSVESATSSRTTFGITKGDACAEARAIRDRAENPTPKAVERAVLSLTFEGPGADDMVDCMTPGSAAGQDIDDDTNALFVRVELKYHALVASILRQPAVTVAASARVALEGAPYAVDPSRRCDGPRSACVDLAQSATAIVRTWPLARFYRPTELAGAPCGPLCDPTTATPLRFSTGDAAYSGVELLDLSRYSSREYPELVGQLITGWDATGSVLAGTAPKADRSGACGRDWDTAGGEAPTAHNARCSLPNWFDYPVGATLSLNTDWDDNDLRAELSPEPEDPPMLNSGRAACRAATATPWLSTPSCSNGNFGAVGDGSVGDWVETSQRGLGSDIVNRMRAFIAREGTVGRFSNEIVPSGPNSGNPYGKAIVMWIYLWDCGQEFDGDEDRKWSSLDEDDECRRRATKRRPVNLRPPDEAADRVHLFSAVPFTFYEGLVTNSAIEAFWGGGFIDPGRCQPDRNCPLNPLGNSAFLVADD
jgi:hypothetical protein